MRTCNHPNITPSEFLTAAKRRTNRPSNDGRHRLPANAEITDRNRSFQDIRSVGRAQVASFFFLSVLLMMLKTVPGQVGSPLNTIWGTVTDTAGGVIPGAGVTLTSMPGGAIRRTQTDERGRFEFSGLAAGEFRIDVQVTGFKKFSQIVSLHNDQRLKVNVRLGVGEISNSITVTASSPGLQKSTGRGRRAGVGNGSGVAGGVVSGVVGLVAPASSTKRGAPSPVRSQADVSSGERANTEAYSQIVDNPFVSVAQDPRSTFAIDVDTASYANMRRFLDANQKPPKDAVRIEELINYFTYDYPPAFGQDAFAVHAEVASAPWNPLHRLLKIGLRGREVALDRRPPSNLVFLIDVSGSMQPEEKLPLLKQAMRLLVQQLNHNDRVAMVVYAGNSGLVLPSTPCHNQQPILQALDKLEAGGSTNGGSGIRLAYDVAIANFVKGGTNRVILATDGDFNVGVTDQGELIQLVQEKARSAVFLSVLGFGMGNLKDSTLEKLADKGHGNYAYIDTLNEARKVLVEQMAGTLLTIAKDVKIQVEFNPAEINAWRLIGYENRLLRHEEFNDDRKEGGDIGAGHTVTALYELVPKGIALDIKEADPLKYQAPPFPTRAGHSGELLTIKVRYKEPEGDKSRLIEFPVMDYGTGFAQASPDFQFAASVAAFGMLLRDSPHKSQCSFADVLECAQRSRGSDAAGYRSDFIALIRKAQALASSAAKH